MSEMWTPGQETKIGSWTPAELRRFIVNTILSDPGALPNTKELPSGAFPGAVLGMLATGGPLWVPGMQMIQDVRLTQEGSVDFDNIPQSFGHLLVITSFRASAAQAGVNNYMQFNGITSGNYWAQLGQFSSTTVSAGVQTLQVGAFVGDSTGDTAATGRRSAGFILIPNYSEGGREQFWMGMSFDYESGSNIRIFGGLLTILTNGITKLHFFPSAGTVLDYMPGTRCTLFGLGTP